MDFKAKDIGRIIPLQGGELKFQPWEGILAPQKAPQPLLVGAPMLRRSCSEDGEELVAGYPAAWGLGQQEPLRARGWDSAKRLAGSVCVSVGGDPRPPGCVHPSRGCLAPLSQVPAPGCSFPLSLLL